VPRATAHGIELEYETIGNPGDPVLLLIMGLGAQLIWWDPDLCQRFVDQGFFVVRFDNRDVGLSTKIDVDVDVAELLPRAVAGEEVDAPYYLSDMADDAAGLLDALGIDRAHVVGASMGGMIAQSLAIRHPHKVLSLTSIMSTTGDSDVGQPDPEVLPILLAPPAPDRESAINSAVAANKMIGSPDHFDEERARQYAALSYDRSYYPKGTSRQLLAIVSSASRSQDLRKLHVNTLVIHGDRDPLVNPTGGQRTAEVVPGAKLLVCEGMGHDLPSFYWDQVVGAITTMAMSSVTAPNR
jgi:pimeloyl-ACP methyl ester carboxylesterase